MPPKIHPSLSPDYKYYFPNPENEELIRRVLEIINDSSIQATSVPNYYGYVATTTGNVWTFKKGSARRLLKTPFIKKLEYQNHGIPKIELHNKNGKEKVYMASLLLACFVSPRPSPESQAIFLDGNHSNLFIDNLKWATVQERMQLASIRNSVKANDSRKVTPDKVRAVRKLKETGLTHRQIAYQIKISEKSVDNIIYGYNWSYIE